MKRKVIEVSFCCKSQYFITGYVCYNIRTHQKEISLSRKLLKKELKIYVEKKNGASSPGHKLTKNISKRIMKVPTEFFYLIVSAEGVERKGAENGVVLE